MLSRDKMKPFEPSKTLLIKLGSLAIHSDEMLSSTGHHFDVEVIRALLNDEEVKEWLSAMDKLSLLPKKR
jgi:hypothetical protein